MPTVVDLISEVGSWSQEVSREDSLKIYSKCKSLEHGKKKCIERGEASNTIPYKWEKEREKEREINLGKMPPIKYWEKELIESIRPPKSETKEVEPGGRNSMSPQEGKSQKTYELVQYDLPFSLGSDLKLEEGFPHLTDIRMENQSVEIS